MAKEYVIGIYIDENTYMKVDSKIIENGKFNWKKSVGTHIIGKYKGIDFDFKVKEYPTGTRKQRPKIKILHDGIEKELNLSKIKTFGGFQILLGLINPNFKYEIGQVIKDERRNIVITNRKRMNGGKYYKYKCLKCGYDCGKCYDVKLNKYKEEYWMDEGGLDCGNGCNCCRKITGFVVKGINDISTTHPYLVPLFKNIEDSYIHTYASNKKVWVVCPDCGAEKLMIINNLQKHGFACKICGDGIKFPNKFMYYILKELNVTFKTEERYDWCKYFNPFKQKESFGIYDFVIEDLKLIIEMDGGWHNSDNKISGQSKEESQWIDNMKDNLAKQNGYKVIRIDCDYENYNNGEYVIHNILQSELTNIFDLNNIDINKCEKKAQNNLVKEVCDYWNINKEKMSMDEIGNVFNLTGATIRNYLKIGNEIKWCVYNPKERMKESALKNNKKTCKKVEIFKDDKSLGTFESCNELERQSEKIFGIKLCQSCISNVCTGKRKTHKGYTFKYKNK